MDTHLRGRLVVEAKAIANVLERCGETAARYQSIRGVLQPTPFATDFRLTDDPTEIAETVDARCKKQVPEPPFVAERIRGGATSAPSTEALSPVRRSSCAASRTTSTAETRLR
jgi:hypothetical protein